MHAVVEQRAIVTDEKRFTASAHRPQVNTLSIVVLVSAWHTAHGPDRAAACDAYPCGVHPTHGVPRVERPPWSEHMVLLRMRMSMSSVHPDWTQHPIPWWTIVGFADKTHDAQTAAMFIVKLVGALQLMQFGISVILVDGQQLYLTVPYAPLLEHRALAWIS